MSSYRSKLLDELSRARFADHARNYDYDLGPEPPPPPGPSRAAVLDAVERFRQAGRLIGEGVGALARAGEFLLRPRTFFARSAAEQIARGEYLYPRLADARSQALLVKLMAFRVLGHRKVKLPRNTPEYWSTLEGVGRYVTADDPIRIKFRDLVLPRFDASGLGYDMRVHSTGVGVTYALCQKQYEYHHGDVHCRVEPGDVVIDAGGCWGETTLYFAHEAGPSGVCVAYEFIPSNLEVLKRNLTLNPHLAPRVRLVERPIWSASGKDLYFVDWGPGSRVSSNLAEYGGRPDGKTSTITIDETVARLGLAKVDFIKMDIEGAELEALKGAEASIRRYRPKLAISLYHRPEDFTEIPRYLDSLSLGYSFYLEHHTLYQNETVLFAIPQPRAIDVAFTLHSQGRLTEAETHYQTLIAEHAATPDGQAARNNLLALYQEQGRFVEAEAIARDALRVAPGDAQWTHRLAIALLRRGAFAEAWPLYESRLRLGSHWATLARLPYPRWTGEAVSSLLVWPEADLSDNLLFARYLPRLRTRGIAATLVCPPLAASLLAPLAHEIVSMSGTVSVPRRDAWIPLGSLPEVLGEPSPPPSPFPRALPKGGGLGVALQAFNAAAVSDEVQAVVAARRADPGARDLDRDLGGLDLLAAARILAPLDEVICAGGPLAHLAASLGKRTRVVLPARNADWRWPGGPGQNPWYPDAKGVRPRADGGWDGLEPQTPSAAPA